MTLDQVQRRAAADGQLAPSSLFRRAACHHAFAALALDSTLLSRHDVESARTISEAALDFITSAATAEPSKCRLFDPGFTRTCRTSPPHGAGTRAVKAGGFTPSTPTGVSPGP